MEIVKNGVTQAVAASKTDQRISNPVKQQNRYEAVYTVILSSIVRATGITLKLRDSHDGLNYADVGDQSEVTVAAAKTAASASDVSTADNEITSTSHGFVTGQPVVYMAGTAAIAGLTTATIYYVVKTGTDTFKLALSQALAYAGTVIDLTSTGTGTQSFFVAQHEIRMLKEDATDLAQLPLKEFVAVFATTGAGDAITVAQIFTPG